MMTKKLQNCQICYAYVLGLSSLQSGLFTICVCVCILYHGMPFIPVYSYYLGFTIYVLSCIGYFIIIL